MFKRALIVVVLGFILGVPWMLRPPAEERVALPPEQVLVVVTPHVPQIQREFSAAFDRWHRRVHGTGAHIDWRQPGGTSDIIKVLRAHYEASARAGAFDFTNAADPMGAPGATSYDVMLGGGSYEHAKLRQGIPLRVDGREVTLPMADRAGFPQERLDEWYGENRIGSGRLYDPEQYWLGTALSGFGIVYNKELYADLGLPLPETFDDLGRVELAGWLALSDPRQSGSVTTTIEAILNAEVTNSARREGWLAALDASLAEAKRLAKAQPEGSTTWFNVLGDEHKPLAEASFARAWALLRRMSGNARYFANSSPKPPIDVSQGEAAAGLAIDFYGRSQAQAILRAGEAPGSGRVGYVDAKGAASIDADPVTILRGGPNPALARRFVEFCLSDEGQALWQYPVTGGEGLGPRWYALRRMPVRRDMYDPNGPHFRHFIDQVNPFALAADSRAVGWRPAIGPMMGAFGIDSAHECREAWGALIRSERDPSFPRERLEEMRALFYAFPETTMPDGRRLAFTPGNFGAIAKAWGNRGVLARCEIDYTAFFRGNYARVVELSRGK